MMYRWFSFRDKISIIFLKIIYKEGKFFLSILLLIIIIIVVVVANNP